jgi:hypothetical protein
MFSATDSTLDLLIFELVLHASLIHLLFLCVGLPVDAWSEGDVLAHARRIERRPSRMTLLEPEFGPSFALRHSRVHSLFHDGRLDLARGLDFLAVVVEAVRDDRLGAVFVGEDLLGRKRRGVVEFFVVGPVFAARWRALVGHFADKA